ncbi:DNA glycosylase AlkZ-like family protein [Streptomyces sp. NPDC002032]|uniref:DNA glycosylase AlkZ-like family protein n=1 Tax=Streptomyces sp. NPDC002032 TaxID=3364630 RepID=UPI003676E570
MEGGNTAWASPGALGGSPVRRSRAPVLLGPFDDLLWHRPRVHGLDGFTHVFEAYKPAARRVHGYYVCPLLAGGRLIGRADLARHDGTLTIHRVTLEPHAGPDATPSPPPPARPASRSPTAPRAALRRQNESTRSEPRASHTHQPGLRSWSTHGARQHRGRVLRRPTAPRSAEENDGDRRGAVRRP